jgi:hypothetical protein
MEEGDAKGFAGARSRGREGERGKYGFCPESREAACRADVDFELYGKYGVSWADDTVEGMSYLPESDLFYLGSGARRGHSNEGRLMLSRVNLSSKTMRVRLMRRGRGG